MRLTLPRTLIVAVTAIIVAISFSAVREFSAVDECLDGGGVYDYAASACRQDVDKLPTAPRSWIRMPDLESVGAALIVAAAFVVVFAIRDRSTRDSRVGG